MNKHVFETLNFFIDEFKRHVVSHYTEDVALHGHVKARPAAQRQIVRQRSWRWKATDAGEPEGDGVATLPSPEGPVAPCRVVVGAEGEGKVLPVFRGGLEL